MSQENVEVVRRSYEAFNKDGLSGAIAFWDPEIVWRTDPLVPEPGVYTGSDAVRTYLEGFLRAFGTWRIDVHEIIDLGGDAASSLLTMAGRPLGETAQETQFLDWAWIVSVRDGKITHVRSFFDKEGAFAAAGLSEQPMSQENMKIVRRSFDAFSRGDLEVILDDLVPEFEFSPSGRFMDTQQTYRGRAGFVDFWDAFRAAWEDVKISIERMEDLGDRVLTLGTFHMTGSGSGVAVDGESGWLHTLKDGRVVHLRSFATWKEALEAAGLREQAGLSAKRNLELIRAGFAAHNRGDLDALVEVYDPDACSKRSS